MPNLIHVATTSGNDIFYNVDKISKFRVSAFQNRQETSKDFNKFMLSVNTTNGDPDKVKCDIVSVHDTIESANAAKVDLIAKFTGK